MSNDHPESIRRGRARLLNQCLQPSREVRSSAAMGWYPMAHSTRQMGEFRELFALMVFRGWWPDRPAVGRALCAGAASAAQPAPRPGPRRDVAAAAARLELRRARLRGLLAGGVPTPAPPPFHDQAER